MSACAWCGEQCGCEGGANSSGEPCCCGPYCCEECEQLYEENQLILVDTLEHRLRRIPLEDYVRAVVALSARRARTA